MVELENAEDGEDGGGEGGGSGEVEEDRIERMDLLIFAGACSIFTQRSLRYKPYKDSNPGPFIPPCSRPLAVDCNPAAMADRAVEVLRGMGYGGRRREEEAQELSVHVRDLPRPLAPPPAPEPGWEERVREERRIRNAVRRWSEKCDAQMKAKAIQAWRTIAWEELNLRRIMRQVRTKLHAWFYETMYSAFEFWKENAQSLNLMRKKTRKVMMWLVKRDVIRALGAWIACWAHTKDWRVCALEGCLQSRAKRYTASEVKSFINSARGAALLHEFSEASAQDLSEKVISSRIDLEALHEHLTVDALTAARIFPSEDQDRAQALIWKLGRRAVGCLVLVDVT